MKIPKKHEMKVVLIFMVLGMTMVITFISNVADLGFSQRFVGNWIKSWLIAYIIALPVAMIMMLFIKTRVSKFVED